MKIKSMAMFSVFQFILFIGFSVFLIDLPAAHAARATAMTAPKKIDATDGKSATEITLSWTAVPEATEYKVYRGTTTKAKESSELAAVANTSYTDTTGKVGESYYYWVKACKESICSAFSSKNKGSLKSPKVNKESQTEVKPAS
ncbi:MAG: hypothetical protein H7832_07520 [Magnetococcus sp. DMHC-6]